MSNDDRPAQQVVLTDPDGRLVSVGGATTSDQQATVTQLQAEWAVRQGLTAFVAKFNDLIDALLTNHWAFLDAYSDRQWPGQDSQPADWPPPPGDPDPTSLAQAITWVKRQMAVIDQRETILRSQLSYVTYAQTREAHLLRLMLGVLAQQIERDPTLVPPTDR